MNSKSKQKLEEENIISLINHPEHYKTKKGHCKIIYKCISTNAEGTG